MYVQFNLLFYAGYCFVTSTSLPEFKDFLISYFKDHFVFSILLEHPIYFRLIKCSFSSYWLFNLWTRLSRYIYRYHVHYVTMATSLDSKAKRRKRWCYNKCSRLHFKRRAFYLGGGDFTFAPVSLDGGVICITGVTKRKGKYFKPSSQN